MGGVGSGVTPVVTKHNPDPGCGHVPTLQTDKPRTEGTEPETPPKKKGWEPAFWLLLCTWERMKNTLSPWARVFLAIWLEQGQQVLGTVISFLRSRLVGMVPSVISPVPEPALATCLRRAEANSD